MNCKTTHLRPFGLLVEPSHVNSDVRGLDIEMLRELFHKEHLVVVRGFRSFDNAEEFSEYCERWGEISLWPFGKVLELVEHDHPEDHIFDANYVPLHWDGMYRQQVPEYQIFHCVVAPQSNQGGETTFSNTTMALERAKPSIRELWSKSTGVYSRKMEYYDSKTIAPIITKHPVRDISVIRYNEPPQDGDDTFINHPDLTFIGVEAEDVASFHQSLREALYAPDNFYAHNWQTGDIVISDNYTLLHGRNAFTSGSPRHLRRVHVLGEPPLNNPHLVKHS